MGTDYVFSLKPNPEIFARDEWDIEQIRGDFRETLRSILRHGCTMEIMMKDISTVRHRPERLWEWTRMASDVAAELADGGTAG